MKEFLKKTYKFSNSWTGTIIIVLFIIFFVAQAFRIPSGSMKDSLLIGDHLFAKKFAYGIPMPHLPFIEMSIMPWSDDLKLIDGDKPERGDIVIFRYPRNEKIHYVKRCVAVEGDILFVHNKDLYLHPHEGNEYVIAHYPSAETVKIDKNEIEYLHNEPFIYIRGEVIPLLFIDSMLDKNDMQDKPLSIVVLNIKGNMLAVVVNEFLGQLDVVQKPLVGIMEAHPLFSGTALLGNGQIIMSIDPHGLLGISASLKAKKQEEVA